MPTKFPSQQELQAYVGQHISKICPRGYSANSDNHCAHFVSHVLGRSVGTNLRVNDEICRLFMTKASNVNLGTKTMINVPRKHVGIYFAAAWKIWHYSNSKHQVVGQRPDEFLFHYSSPDNAVNYRDLHANLPRTIRIPRSGARAGAGQGLGRAPRRDRVGPQQGTRARDRDDRARLSTPEWRSTWQQFEPALAASAGESSSSRTTPLHDERRPGRRQIRLRRSLPVRHHQRVRASAAVSEHLAY